MKTVNLKTLKACVAHVDQAVKYFHDQIEGGDQIVLKYPVAKDKCKLCATSKT